MAILEFVGCGLIAYGPSAAISLLTIIDNPMKVILLVISAFFWLLAIILSSTIWVLLSYKSLLVVHVINAVIMQEIFRYIAYKCIYRTEEVMRRITGVQLKFIPEDTTVAYVAGFGFGLISGLFSFVNILAELTGPGTVGLDGEPEIFSLISAGVTSCFIILHTFWGIIFFDSLRNQNYIGVKYVVVSHVLVSCMTLSHRLHNYIIPFGTILLVTLFTVLFSYKILGGKYQSLLHVCFNKQRDTL